MVSAFRFYKNVKKNVIYEEFLYTDFWVSNYTALKAKYKKELLRLSN